MFENLNVFRISTAMAKHAGQQQAIVAENVANADTPDYVARSMPDFKSIYMPAADDVTQRATRGSHLNGSMGADQLGTAAEVGSQASPNGNQVSIETEILKSVDAKRQHDRAMAIYKTSLNVLRSSLRTN